MTQITLQGTPIHTHGQLPAEGSEAPAFRLVGTGLATASLDDYAGKKILNVFPSLDTPVCAMSIRRFAQEATGRQGVSVLNISADLPFAHSRFCTAEDIEGVDNLSTLRSSFGRDYGLEIVDGPLAGLCSRAVLVLDEENRVVYREQVPEIGQEPDYEAALAAL